MKTVVVGDGAIGKTCLMNAIKRPDEEMETAYESTVADNEVMEWKYDEADWEVDVWDTAGQEAFNKLRTGAYPDSNVIMVGFDMTNPTSLANITEKDKGWIKEIESKMPGFTSYILVGTKADMWKENPKGGVTEDQYWAVAEEIGAKAVIMTSAKTKTNCEELKQAVLRIGIGHKSGRACSIAKRPVVKQAEAVDDTEGPTEANDTQKGASAEAADDTKEDTKRKDAKEGADGEKDGCECTLL